MRTPTFQTAQQTMVTTTASGQNLVFFSGVAGVEFMANSESWQRDQLEIRLPGGFDSVESGVGGASLAAIHDPGFNPQNFGFAVDKAELFWGPLRVICDLAVQDIGAQILRVSYYAVVLGTRYQAPPILT